MIVHRPGCSWETGPCCDCGADPERSTRSEPIAEPFAWTPDDEIERGVEEFKRLWPEKWQAWLDWCDSDAANETHYISPDAS